MVIEIAFQPVCGPVSPVSSVSIYDRMTLVSSLDTAPQQHQRLAEAPLPTTAAAHTINFLISIEHSHLYPPLLASSKCLTIVCPSEEKFRSARFFCRGMKSCLPDSISKCVWSRLLCILRYWIGESSRELGNYRFWSAIALGPPQPANP